MAKKTTTPPIQLAATCVSDAAFSHGNLIIDVRFDGPERLLCTDSWGTWSVWSVPEGELVWRGTSTLDNGPLPLGYHLRVQPVGRGLLLGYAGELDEDARYKVSPALMRIEDRAVVGIIQDDALAAGGWRGVLGGVETLVIVTQQRVVVLDADTMERVAVWELPQLRDPGDVLRDGDVLAGHMPSGCWTLNIKTGALQLLTAGGARCLAVGAAAGLAAIMEMSSPRDVLLRGLDGGASRVFETGFLEGWTSAAFGPGGDTLLVSGAKGELACYALPSGEQRWCTRLELYASRLAVRADGLIAAGCGHRVTLVDGASGAVVRCAGPPWPIAGLSFRAEPPTVCVTPMASGVALGRSAFAYRLDTPPRGEPLAAAVPDGRVFVELADGQAAWWGAARKTGKKTEQVLERLARVDGAWAPVAVLAREARKQPALWLALCEGAGLLVASSETREVCVYDLASDALLHTLSGLKYAATRVAVSPDGAFVAAVGGKQLMCWSLVTGEAWEQKAPEQLIGIAVSPDAATIITVDDGPNMRRPALLRVWDAASGAARATYAPPWCGASRAMGFGPDGALYMMASDTNVYRVTLV